MDSTHLWTAIVDDDNAVRRALLRLTRAAGLTARTFESGQALLATLTTDMPPCCAILDLHMPLMDGFKLQQHLAAISPGTGVILMTGYSSPEIEAKVMLHQPTAYLSKPLHAEQLLAAISTIYAIK